MAFSTEFDVIREARKGDDTTLSQGDWVTQVKTPQWGTVRTQCEKLLKESTKDLQLAVWYTDVLTRLEGFQGFAFGMQVITGLFEQFWDSAYPSNEDPDERISKMEWLAAQTPLVIRNIPMTKGQGYSYLKWEESRQVENLGLKDSAAKEAAIADGKLSSEQFDRAVKESGTAFYQTLSLAIDACLEACGKLQGILDDRYGSSGPDLMDVTKALQECRQLCSQCMSAFPALRHQTMEGTATIDAEPQATPSDAPPCAAVGAVPVASKALNTREDAIERLREVARYFRTHEPHSPVAPLVERAASWAEMPLEVWLAKVIKDSSTLEQLRELLDLPMQE